jgi:internalin A
MPVSISSLLRRTAVLRTDRELLQAFLSGTDPAAFDELVCRHGRLAQCAAAEVCPAEAEDVAQATLALLARKAADVAGRESAAGWVFETARRLALHARSASARRTARESGAAAPRAASDPHETITLRELRAIVAEELAQLPDELRLPLVLCYWDGADRSTAARRLGCSVSTLKRRLESARDRLGARLARRGFGGPAVLAALVEIQARSEAAGSVVMAAPSGFAVRKVVAAVLIAAGVAAAGVAIAVSFPFCTDAQLDSDHPNSNPLALNRAANVAGQPDALAASARAPVPPPIPPQPIDQKIIYAWEQVGAKFGWMKFDEVGRLQFRAATDGTRLRGELAGSSPSREGKIGEFPGFHFPAKWVAPNGADRGPDARHESLNWRPAPETFKRLPPPDVPFGLDLSHTSISEADLADLAGFTELRALNLSSSPVTDDGLKGLGGLNQLEALDLSNSPVTGAGLAHLAKLDGLRVLHLGWTRVSDSDIGPLSQLGELRILNLTSASRLTDTGLAPLESLRQLRVLDLSHTKVTDAGMKHLAPLTELRGLNVRNTQISDDGLPAFAEMKDLLTLDLRNTSVTGTGFRALAGLTDLRTVDLTYSKASDAGLKELSRFKELRSLSLEKTLATDVGVREIAGLTKLEELCLSEVGVTDASMKVIAGLKELQTLDLAGTRVTDAGVKELESLTRLQSLSLERTKVTCAILEHLAILKELHSLDLAETQVNDSGLERLSDLAELHSLNLRDTRITDVSLKHFVACKGLRALGLEGTGATPEGLEALRNMIPACRITPRRPLEDP